MHSMMVRMAETCQPYGVYMCVCVQCIIERVSETSPVCPYDGCGVEVADPGKVVDDCRTDLEQLYPSVQASVEVEELQSCGMPSTGERINVVMLTGDSVSLPFDPAMTVERLRTEIKTRLGVDEDKQQLVYNDRVLEVRLLKPWFRVKIKFFKIILFHFRRGSVLK